MRTSIIHTLFIAIFALVVPAPTTAQNALPEEVTVCFAAHSIELQALFGQLREGFRAALDEAGLNYEFFQAAPNDSSDHAGMVSILENFATQQCDYTLVGPTSLELNEPGLTMLAESGSKLLMTDYERPEGGVPYEDAVLNWVVYRHDEMGYKAGDWLVNYFRSVGNYNPKIVMLWGPAASEISEARGSGVLQAFEDAEDINPEIVYEAYADFNREKAYTETERAVAAYDFDAIVGLNSYMAVSAKDALMANGMLDQVVVAGMGGTIDELQAVALEEIGVAPFRDPRSMGRASATALLMDLQGRGDEIERTSYANISGCRLDLSDCSIRATGNVRRSDLS